MADGQLKGFLDWYKGLAPCKKALLTTEELAAFPTWFSSLPPNEQLSFSNWYNKQYLKNNFLDQGKERSHALQSSFLYGEGKMILTEDDPSNAPSLAFKLLSSKARSDKEAEPHFLHGVSIWRKKPVQDDASIKKSPVIKKLK